MEGIAEPVYVSLKEHRRFGWNKLEENALADIKEEIRKREALVPFETGPDRTVRLICNTCERGIGAMLKQEQKGGYINKSCIGIQCSGNTTELWHIWKRNSWRA